jgi:hypothetical protein
MRFSGAPPVIFGYQKGYFMRCSLRKAKINVGQFRLLSLIAKKYDLSPEDIVNSLIEDYNNIHVESLINNDSIYRKSISVKDLCKTLETVPEVEFLDIKYKNTQDSRNHQIQSIDEALDALL